MEKIGRNDPCPCGSGKKHKKCCIETAPRGYHHRPGAEAPAVSYESAGIRTWMDDEGLHITAPQGAVSDEDMAKIADDFKRGLRKSPVFEKLQKKFGLAEAEKILSQIELKEK